MILFDFKCVVCSHVFERLVTSDQRTDVCPECGGVASRVISPVRCKLDPISGHFPSATAKWAKEHEAGAKRCTRTSD